MLEMHEEAWETLNLVPDFQQDEEEVLLMRIDLAIAQENWPIGAQLARKAVKVHPAVLSFYLNGAYCIRRAEDLEAAYPFLLAARRNCDKLSALWHYNLACYEAQRGNLGAVDQPFQKAIAMDKRYEALAKKDPDLKPWLDSLNDA